MNKQEQKHQQYKHYHKIYLITTIITLSVCAAIALGVLNILGIINGPWSNILIFVFAALSVIIAAFGVVIALIQKTHSGKAEGDNKPVPPVANEQDSSAKKLHVQVEGIDLGANESAGALVVYARKTMLGESVDLHRKLSSPLVHSTSNIVRRKVNNEVICAAVFPCLEPSDYIVSDASGNYNTRITVLPRFVSEIDWRTTRSR